MHITKSFRGLAPFSRGVQELCRLLHEWGKGGVEWIERSIRNCSDLGTVTVLCGEERA